VTIVEVESTEHFFIQQEGNGLSPYRGEDPELFRLVAQRT
jgi:hypothetical protein